MRISDKIKQQGFVTTCEIDSPKGIGIEEFLDKVDTVKNYVDAITAGDNQRAVMRAAPLAICHILKERNVEPIMELSALYRNRLALQSDLLGAGIMGIENILLHDGWDPTIGDHIEAKLVHDLDCCALVKAATSLSRGGDLSGHPLNEAPDFCVGILVNISQEFDSDQVSQLEDKVAAGAQFVVTQPLYDSVVLEGFLKAIKGINIPIIVGHMMIKSASMARFVNSNLPGVTVPERIIRELEKSPREQVAEKSLQISVNLLKELKPLCQGFHFVPAGWERYVGNLVQEVVEKTTINH
ncbi:MAG: methylenetetrahydrofolate reductase [Dehalococcoidales bacterium]|nr:methylenetetrahydrofolate reductase [Dehalococcoidales bacterium]